MSCPANHFSAALASTSCAECPTGRYSGLIGATNGAECRYYAPLSSANVPVDITAGDVLQVPLDLRIDTGGKMQGDADFNSTWIKCTANSTTITSAFEQIFQNAFEVSCDERRSDDICHFF